MSCVSSSGGAVSSREKASFLSPSSKVATAPTGVVDVSVVVPATSVGLLAQSESLLDGWKGWLYELSSDEQYGVKLLRLGKSSLEVLYEGSSTTPNLEFKVTADSYMIFEVTSPSGQVSMGILGPAFGDKSSVMLVLDRTSTVAARVLLKIFERALGGDQSADRVLSGYLLSPASVYAASYAALLVVDEQARSSLSGRELSMEQLAEGFVAETVFDVNCLVLDEENVIFSAYNKQVFDFCRRHHINPIISELRHSYFWDGGVSCCTQDLTRRGGLETYL